ncbi:Hypothetical protein MVR_LOCUS275 [uncultured virus]|nr:Hypothetical protein MVR_LOCUS275 [uncultured virus]
MQSNNDTDRLNRALTTLFDTDRNPGTLANLGNLNTAANVNSSVVPFQQQQTQLQSSSLLPSSQAPLQSSPLGTYNPSSTFVPLDPATTIANQDMINAITNELNKHTQTVNTIKRFTDAKVNYNTNLLIDLDEHKVSTYCLLHYFSLEPAFLAQYRTQCSQFIDRFFRVDPVTAKSNLNMSTLLVLSGKLDRDINLFVKLYYLVMSLVAYITGKDFVKLPNNIKFNLYNNIASLTKQTLDYEHKFINHYRAMDNDLLTFGYNLLLILNKLTIKLDYNNLGARDITQSYNEMRSLVSKNLDLYNDFFTRNMQGFKNVENPLSYNDIANFNNLQNINKSLELQNAAIKNSLVNNKLNTTSADKVLNALLARLDENNPSRSLNASGLATKNAPVGNITPTGRSF